MAVIRVNAEGAEPVLHGSPHPVIPVLERQLAQQPGPVTVVLHGYRYQPGSACPHTHLFALAGGRNHPRVISWPRHLGYGTRNRAPGALVCFGWHGRGTVQQAYDRAALAGRAVAVLIHQIKTFAPNRPVRLFAHSMGARVALQALHHLSAHSVDLAILLSAAEFSTAASSALNTPAGKSANILHVTSRENAVYDALLEHLVSPMHRKDRAMGRLLVRSDLACSDNISTLHLDDPDTLRALAGLGHRIAPPQKRICHWFSYLRPGVFGLYRALLSGALSPERLASALPTEDPRQRRPHSRTQIRVSQVI